MKTITLILFALFICSYTLHSMSGRPADEAASMGKQGIESINKGEFKKAIELFSKAMELDPAQIEYPYEKALALYQMRDFDETIHLLDSLKNHPQVNDQVYQLLGNSYDNLHKSDSAFQVYQEGLIKFPNSGRLYMEMGLTELNNKKKARDVIIHWENGVRFDPQFPNNYYLLAGYFSNTGEKLWTLFYGELFAHLSNNVKKLQENSRLLFENFNNSLFNSKDSTLDVKFTTARIITSPEKSADTAGERFKLAFQRIMSHAVLSVVNNNIKQATIKDIHQIRTKFVELWYKEKLNKKFPNILIDRYKLLIDNKVFEAYDYWLFKEGNNNEFKEWNKNNKGALDKFMKWYSENPLTIDSNHNFLRFNYE